MRRKILKVQIEIPNNVYNFLQENPESGREVLQKNFGLDEVSARFYRKAWLNQSKDREYKKVVVISDLHCGHLAGLTPPHWHTDRNRWGENQQEVWKLYCASILLQQPIDVLIVNGDAIDGKGPKSGGTELITSDRNEQCRMAVECIKYCEAKKIVCIAGTAFHTGAEEDFEEQIAAGVGATLGSQEWIDINSIILDVKHHLSNNSLPHTKGTAVSRDQLWNVYLSAMEIQPKADIIIRSHIHKAIAVRDSNRSLAIVTPGLQGFGSKFGSRRVSGTIDVGITWFNIYNDGKYTWDFDIFNIYTHQPEIIKI